MTQIKKLSLLFVMAICVTPAYKTVGHNLETNRTGRQLQGPPQLYSLRRGGATNRLESSTDYQSPLPIQPKSSESETQSAATPYVDQPVNENGIAASRETLSPLGAELSSVLLVNGTLTEQLEPISPEEFRRRVDDLKQSADRLVNSLRHNAAAYIRRFIESAMNLDQHIQTRSGELLDAVYRSADELNADNQGLTEGAVSSEMPNTISPSTEAT